MPKFAIYYVPDANDEFYRIGSQLLYYDVRAQAPPAMSSQVRDQLTTFDDAWVATAQPYGFHLTLGDAIECTDAAIPLVEQELEMLALCFDPAHPWTLQQRQPEPISVWGEVGKEIIVLRYEPNDYVKMLHALIVACINPLGIGSGYLQRHLLHPEELSPLGAQRTRLFYSPFILDDWTPHFTLLNPYHGGDHQGIATRLARLFTDFQSLVIHSLCLMIQMHDTDNWHIYSEFLRPNS
jgi:hypothetical protein